MLREDSEMDSCYRHGRVSINKPVLKNVPKISCDQTQEELIKSQEKIKELAPVFDPELHTVCFLLVLPENHFHCSPFRNKGKEIFRLYFLN